MPWDERANARSVAEEARRPDGDRRNGDPLGVRLGGQRLIAAAGGLAVAEHDHVLHAGGRGLERLVGGAHAGVDVRAAAGVERGDARLDLALLALWGRHNTT